jgi:hypothetical protein
VKNPPLGNAVERYHNENRRGPRGMISQFFFYAFSCFIFGDPKVVEKNAEILNKVVVTGNCIYNCGN